MSWEWEALTGVVRLLFLLAPFMKVEAAFSLAGDTLHEAKEFAQASSCRALLVSFPAELFLVILAQASNTQCRTVNWLLIAGYVVVGFVLAFGLFKIPARYYRGPFHPFLLFIIITALSIVFKTYGLAPVVALICQ